MRVGVTLPEGLRSLRFEVVATAIRVGSRLCEGRRWERLPGAGFLLPGFEAAIRVGVTLPEGCDGSLKFEV